MIYADIIVDISHEKLDRSFQYLVPRELEGRSALEWLLPFLLEMETVNGKVM